MKNWKVDEKQEADEKLIFWKLQPLASYKRVSLKNTCSNWNSLPYLNESWL